MRSSSIDLIDSSVDSSIAQEGLIRSKSNAVNMDLATKHNVLFVFSTTPEAEYGSADFSAYFRARGSRPLVLHIDYQKLRRHLFAGKKYIGYHKYDKTLIPFIIKYYKAAVKTSAFSHSNMTYGEAARIIIDACEEYCAKNQCVAAIVTSDSSMFSYTILRDYPIIITNGSFVKAFVSTIGLSSAIKVTDYANRENEFIRLCTEYDPKMVIRGDKLGYPLYHVSSSPDIKEFTPRVTNKPLDAENAAIPRISAAPTLDKCIRGVGTSNIEKFKPAYLYRFILKPNTKIIKPTLDLVPDADLTFEHWIMNEVKAELLGSFELEYEPERRAYKMINITFDQNEILEDVEAMKALRQVAVK